MLPWTLGELEREPAKLEEILTNGFSESHTLEFKRLLLSSTEDEKLELLKTVSAFANSSGGDVLFGVQAEDGIATVLSGVPHSEIDGFKRKLESITRDNLEPSLPAGCLSFAAIQIPIVDGRVVLLARIAQSWLKPHRIGKKGHREFWTRTSAGKEPMTIWQLRDAFALSSEIEERAREFVSRSAENCLRDVGLPISLPTDEPRFVLHILPISAFSRSQIRFDVVSYRERGEVLRPIGAPHNTGCRLNLHGLVTSYGGNRKSLSSYTQIYRDGTIEALRCIPAPLRASSLPTAPVRDLSIIAFEDELREALQRYVAELSGQKIFPPLYLFLSLIAAGNCRLVYSPFQHIESPNTVDHNLAILPEAVLNAESELDRALKELLDSLWNAAGYPHSPSFAESGAWLQKPVHR